MILGNILYIAIGILLLGVLVVVHEFGHYLAGRLTGMTVLEFSVGFGPKLVGWRRNDIDYSLRAIPFGGFCKFLGEDEDNSDPRAMNRQPAWRRFVTVLSGPLMNFIFALVVSVVMLMGYEYAEVYPSIAEISADMPAAAAGLLPGDDIVEADGVDIARSGEGAQLLRQIIAASPADHPVELVVERAGERIAVSMLPQLVEFSDGSSAYQIGILFEGRGYSLGESLSEAPRRMALTVEGMLDFLKNLVFRGEGIDDVVGPVGIIAMTGEIAREGLYMVLQILFFISLNLGLMNLLPLPALDGGRLVFLAWEGISRRPVPAEKEGLVHGVGFVLLMGMILFFTFKDVMRLIAG